MTNSATNAASNQQLESSVKEAAKEIVDRHDTLSTDRAVRRGQVEAIIERCFSAETKSDL